MHSTVSTTDYIYIEYLYKYKKAESTYNVACLNVNSRMIYCTRSAPKEPESRVRSFKPELRSIDHSNKESTTMLSFLSAFPRILGIMDEIGEVPVIC